MYNTMNATINPLNLQWITSYLDIDYLSSGHYRTTYCQQLGVVECFL